MMQRITLLDSNCTLGDLVVTDHHQNQQSNCEAALGCLETLTEVAKMLQVVHDHNASPVIVHSGFRSSDLNRASRGSRYSQHRKGEAADFHVLGQDLTEVWTWLWQHSGIEFGQLILEGRQAGEPTWIHLSPGAPWRSRDRTGQVFTCDDEHGYRRVDAH